MIEQLRSAADQLRAAWDNYYRVYSILQNYDPIVSKSNARGFLPEFATQLNTELDYISSLEPKVHEVKVAISRARNFSSSLVPINTLPPEILTHIFHIIHAQSCNYHHMRYPDDLRCRDYLAQVCALWRRTALSSRSLWAHIDLSGDKKGYDGIMDRADAYVARAGELPLELHIVDQSWTYCARGKHGYYDICQLVKQVAGRVGTLGFDVIHSTLMPYHSKIFDYIFSGQPRMLTNITIRSNQCNGSFYSSPDYYLPLEEVDEQDREELNSLYLDSTEDAIENTFAGLEVLHLRGIFPRWSSSAYSGLVDLRLLSAYQQSHIKESELISILGSSPALRILHFGLGLTNPAPDTEEVTRVQLHELEAIKISVEQLHKLPRIFRLLAPAARPIRLSLDCYDEPDAIFMADMEQFFSRSRVEIFYTWRHLPPMRMLIPHAAHLEYVVLDYFDGRPLESTPTWFRVEELPLTQHLKSLYVTSSRLTETQLRLLVKHCPTGIVFHSCSVHPDNNPEEEVTLDSFPSVRVTEHTSYPVGDWDILD